MGTGGDLHRRKEEKFKKERKKEEIQIIRIYSVGIGLFMLAIFTERVMFVKKIGCLLGEFPIGVNSFEECLQGLSASLKCDVSGVSFACLCML